tara:strand:+ start:119 stop:763 length:645 start_codon:yes stop_codon:yes gene_type:complete
MIKNLTFSDGVSTSFKLAINQIWAIVGAWILWILTIWIPYINVGTTIGLIRLQIQLGRGESINSADIFDADNRAAMGNIFLVWSFMTTGVIIGLIFFVIPGFVLFYAWFLSTMLVLDKKLGPVDALVKSYELTYGHKWTIFFIVAIIQLVVGAFSLLFDTQIWDIYQYGYGNDPLLFWFLNIGYIIINILGAAWMMTSYGYIYSVLSGSKKSKK